MNIVGKILVILNLVFAFAVGGFLVFDVATRTNWKNAIEGRDRDLNSAYTSIKTWEETAQKQQNELKKARLRITELEKGGVNAAELANVNRTKVELDMEELRQQVKQAELRS